MSPSHHHPRAAAYLSTVHHHPHAAHVGVHRPAASVHHAVRAARGWRRESGWEGTGVRVVVGAVLRDADGRVLAARRERPAGWELPGGKVEPGETEPAALVRELREELGVTVEVGDRVGPDVPIGPDFLLRAWTVVVTAGEPAPLEHAELRWLAEADLDSVPWLPADRPIVTALTAPARSAPC